MAETKTTTVAPKPTKTATQQKQSSNLIASLAPFFMHINRLFIMESRLR